MRHASYRAKGRRWVSGPGGAANFDPCSERKNFPKLPANTDEFLITEICGIQLGNFNHIQFHIIGAAQTGGTAGVNLIMQFSENEGEPVLSGASDYVGFSMAAAGATGLVGAHFILYDGAIGWNSTVWIDAVNSNIPTQWRGFDTSLTDGSVRSRGGYTWTSLAPTKAIKFTVIASSGTPLFSAGALDITGHR